MLALLLCRAQFIICVSCDIHVIITSSITARHVTTYLVNESELLLFRCWLYLHKGNAVFTQSSLHNKTNNTHNILINDVQWSPGMKLTTLTIYSLMRGRAMISWNETNNTHNILIDERTCNDLLECYEYTITWFQGCLVIWNGLGTLAMHPTEFLWKRERERMKLLSWQPNV